MNIEAAMLSTSSTSYNATFVFLELLVSIQRRKPPPKKTFPLTVKSMPSLVPPASSQTLLPFDFLLIRDVLALFLSLFSEDADLVSL